MIPEIRQTRQFIAWCFDELRDLRARARIQSRIDRLSLGNPGDVKPVGSGVSELRIDYGPGYRVYFVKRGSQLIVLLARGDIDLNAGVILDESRAVEEVGRELFDQILAVASGQMVKAEENGHREFMIWSEEGVSL